MIAKLERLDRKTIMARTLIGSGDRSIQSVSRDISRSGVFVECNESLKVGDTVTLFIEDRRTASVIWVISRVVRVKAGVGFAAQFTIDNPMARREFAKLVDGLPPLN